MRSLNRHQRREQEALIRRGKLKGVVIVQFRDMGNATIGTLKVDNVVKAAKAFPLLDSAGKVDAATTMEREWKEQNK